MSTASSSSKTTTPTSTYVKEGKEFLLELENDDCSALLLKSEIDIKSASTCSSMQQKVCKMQVPNNSAINKWYSRVFRGKQFLGILCIIILLLYMNSTLMRSDVNEHIPVIHYSHVPGMKVRKEYLINSTNFLTTTITKTIKTTTNPTTIITPTTLASTNETLGYLVWSDSCKMPNINPYSSEVMKFFQREKYKPCANKKPLTSIEYDEAAKSYVLLFIEKNLKLYGSSGNIRCCYQCINRNFSDAKADKEISLGHCKEFEKKVALPSSADNIIVRCHKKNKQVYINGHPMMPNREDIFERQKLLTSDNDSRSPSVLMIGIDSISRINLIRAMPKTAQYLYDNEWFEMSGYNKIDDNTFPNLMAVLTGRNQTNVYANCNPKKLGGLEKCNFIWKDFQARGYVTAYAEDESSINTFNYLKMGFEKPPVDYYLRPFLIGAEKKLNIKRKSGLIYCLGYQHSAEYVYDYALQLVQRYKEKPFFGLFWTNTFSHNDISDCSSMDERMVDYLKEFADLGTFNNTIVIFFSDHGMRFGPTRKTLSGHYEERLPFMFIWLPPYIKQTHPEFVSALSMNKNRLTNPYDLHMTLKHILTLTKQANETLRLLEQPAISCARCQSLLRAVPHNRSCEEIEIEDHWCTCVPYQSIYKDSKLMHKLAHDTIDYINNYVREFRNGSYAQQCATLSLQNMEFAYRAHSFNNCANCIETYRLVFYTKPNRALFEATVRYNAHTQSLNVTGEISRLNSYATDSECVSDGGAKKYCSCYKRHKHG